jgi:hypothetical protein
MKYLSIAIAAAALLAWSTPSDAHRWHRWSGQHCGWQWPGNDGSSSDNPTFSSTDCMANQLNQQVLSGQLR